MTTELVTIHHPVTGGVGEIPKAAVRAWEGLGWIEGPPPAPESDQAETPPPAGTESSKPAGNPAKQPARTANSNVIEHDGGSDG